MPVALKPLLAEFAAYLDRTRLERRIQLVHQGLVAAGMLGCLVVLWRHFGLAIGGEHAPYMDRNVLLSLSLANITATSIAVMYGEERALRRLQQDRATVEGRAAQVTDYVVRRGQGLLAMALIGQALVWFAAARGIRLLSLDAPLVVLNLLPTAQQIWLGMREIPNRKRLMSLYKLVALYHERARLARERVQGDG